MDVKTSVLSLVPAVLRKYTARIETSPLGYRLARGTFWSLTGALISRGLALVASIILARFLGKEGFGELGMIQSTVGMFGIFAGFGLGTTATKHVAEFKGKDPIKTANIIRLSMTIAICMGMIMSGALAVLSPWIATKTLAAPQLTNLLRISSILLFLGSLNGAQIGALSGFEAFKSIAKINIFVGVWSLPLMGLGVYFGGLYGALWALVASTALACIVSRNAITMEAKKYEVSLSRGWMQEWPILWNFSLPAVLAGALVGPVNWLCSAMLVNQHGGYAEMGIFNAANQWFGALLFLPSILGQAVLPIFSERVAINDQSNTKKLLAYSIKINAVVVIPIVFVVCLASPVIMRLYGESFKDSWPTLIIVLLTAALLAVQISVGQILIASARIWTGFLMNMGWAIVFLIATKVLINWGSLGLSLARFVGYFFHSIWTFGYALYVLKDNRMVK
jgi:O-antigen/teichoic acid export membrane protein